jgi:hypothetical protein
MGGGGRAVAKAKPKAGPMRRAPVKGKGKKGRKGGKKGKKGGKRAAKKGGTYLSISKIPLFYPNIILWHYSL